MAASVFQLQCSCNNYDWGRVGKNSLAATLCSRTPNSDFEIQDKPYAEMWMGDYPVQPAKDLKNGESLHTIIASNADKLLGRKCVDKFGGVGAPSDIPSAASYVHCTPSSIVEKVKEF